MAGEKVQLNVRISPIFLNLLEKEIAKAKAQGKVIKKNEMVEQAILCLVEKNAGKPD